jgi:hypothetical protein
LFNDGVCIVKPEATYALDKKSQFLIYEWLKSLWFPDRYASNIAR